MLGLIQVNNGLQVLGGYGFCSDFILQQYYRDIRISAIYEGTTGIQSQDLLGRKITMNNGEGLKLLLAEIIETITKASNYPELKEYCDSLSEKIKLSEKVLQSLMPYALKGDFEKYLADASIFMEFFSLVIVGWNWLEIAANSQQALKNEIENTQRFFYTSKIETMKYFFEYELPKTISHSEIIMNPSSVTIKKEGEILI
jgi:butyryl-CoA dehydrogenase